MLVNITYHKVHCDGGSEMAQVEVQRQQGPRSLVGAKRAQGSASLRSGTPDHQVCWRVEEARLEHATDDDDHFDDKLRGTWLVEIVPRNNVLLA